MKDHTNSGYILRSGLLLVSGLSILFLFGCKDPESTTSRKDRAKQEILQAELDFAALCDAAGVGEAFLEYASDSAVLNRTGTVIRGKNEIREYFDSWNFSDVNLDWKADFVDAAESGDMGYTIGKYQFLGVDSAGQVTRASGIFHTVWKKDRQGKWKYVYD